MIVLINCALCLLVDYILLLLPLKNTDQFIRLRIHLLRALLDNFTHASSSALSWISVLILVKDESKEKERGKNECTHRDLESPANTTECTSSMCPTNSKESSPKYPIKSKECSSNSVLENCDINDFVRFLIIHIREIFISFVISSFLDFDHFIAARSYSFFAATNLQFRPFGHNLLFLIATTILLLIFTTRRFSLLCFSAIFNHLTRDAIRRGYTYSPFFSYSTYKVLYVLYLCTIIFAPYLLSFVLRKYPSLLGAHCLSV